jgi:hypothetical protein
MAIPEFLDLLNKMRDIHEKKNQDYAATNKPFENFERSGEIASWFDDPIDKAFTILIGTKLARLATLLNKKGTPNNESIEDSFLDLTTYCALWASHHNRKTYEKSWVCTHCNRVFHFTPTMIGQYTYCSDSCASASNPRIISGA